MADNTRLEQVLDGFDKAKRLSALREIATSGEKFKPAGANLNMHLHSFFSYNANNWSPTHLALAAKRSGLYAAGLCDFDVLDGLEEFLEAGRILGLRATVNLETRAYLKAFADFELTSPGEPGVTYIMGAGFPRMPAAGTPQAKALQAFRDQARARNIALLGRVNPRLPKIALDYEKNVLPLTPAGVATERHIIRAYNLKSRAAFAKPDELTAFWAETLGKDAASIGKLLADEPALEEAIRPKLVKKGGIGYEQPTTTTFPPVEDFVAWVRSCEAIPMATWLDGTSNGESNENKLLDVMVEKGCAAVNIIPDRNWNLRDPKQAEVKRANLAKIVAAAVKRALPVNIGTEMNKAGLPFVDDLGGEVLRLYKEPFTRGAQLMVGHQILTRYANFSYAGTAAAAEFKKLADRNAFFASAGALPPLTEAVDRQLTDVGPVKALTAIRDVVRKGAW